MRALLAAAVSIALALPAAAAVQWNGFLLLRPQTRAASPPLDDDALSAQLQVGLDWRPSPSFGTHVHLLARNEEDGSRRGRAGIVEAYAEGNAHLGGDRVRVLAGAFFLPISRENIDSLWESPYTITSSALNSWLGEELRPIGVDVTYRHPMTKLGVITGAATAFIGNDTFGAMPIDRGWELRDHWMLLGEHLPVTPVFYTSVSAENDDRIGWSARGKWNNDKGALQLARIDNRSDARRYGELFNWATRFNIVSGDYSWRAWTAVAEYGWGTTAIQGTRARFSFPIRAGYVLVSRGMFGGRGTLRVDEYEVRANEAHAFTAAYLHDFRRRFRAGVEGIVAGDEKRLAVELRVHF